MTPVHRGVNPAVEIRSPRSGEADARDTETMVGRPGWRWPRLTVSDLLLPSALILWAIGIREANTSALDQYGLMTAAPLAYFTGFLVLIVSIGFQLARRELSAPRLALHVATLVFMIHGTAPLLYAGPRYSWTYKHFGVVNHINVYGGLDASIDIYNNWPGFFALAAWFGRIAGFDSPLAYAAWSQLFVNLLACLELGFAFRALPLTDRERWLALSFSLRPATGSPKITSPLRRSASSSASEYSRSPSIGYVIMAHQVG